MRAAENGRVRRGESRSAERSNARVAKNGDPRLKTEQRQGMQCIAAHLAAGGLTASPGYRAAANARTR